MRLQRLLLAAALALVPSMGLAQQRAVQPQPQAEQPPPPLPPLPPLRPMTDPKVARRITADEVKRRIEAGETVVVVDTRSKFTGPMAKGATQVAIDKLATWAKDRPKDAFIVTYCTCPSEHTSMLAVLRLQELGFTKAYALSGGLSAWTLAELPTEAPPVAGPR